MDDYLACLISHCPLLQKLTIIKCNGLQKPDVSALNLTYLEVEADEMEVLMLNCPKLISLNAVSCPISDLSVNGVLFYEFSFMVRVLKLQCGNDVTELWLDSSVVDSEGNLSAERLFEMVWAFKSLKKLSMDIYELLEREREGMSVPFVKLLERLPHLERLEMRGRFFRELTGDEIPPCLSSPLVNLRIIQVHIDDSDSMEINERQIAMLGCLLQSTPSLEILKFQLLSDLYVTAQHTGVVEKILRLRGTSTQARIFQGLIL
uniref:FBD domain-containing protein n=1 Tax=Picea sitchensis TaxID=3332 RepID=D5A8V8_PICSI|nr:unknown [Picea sitchensis]